MHNNIIAAVLVGHGRGIPGRRLERALLLVERPQGLRPTYLPYSTPL